MLIFLISLASAAPSLTGSYALAEDPTTLAATHAAAVDRGAQQLPWAMRGFARPKLASTVGNCGKLDLVFDDEALRVVCDNDPGLRVPRATSDTDVTIKGRDGEPVKVRLTATEAMVKLSFFASEGGQHTEYTRHTDGSLQVTKEIFSKWLPDPIRWSVRYAPRATD